MPETPQNAVWELFSGKKEKVRFGLQAYQPRTPDIQGVMATLFKHHKVGGRDMAYTWEDFRRDYTKENLHELSVEERLEGLSPDEVLRRFSPDKRLEGLSLEDIEAYLRRQKQTKGRARGD